jgi:hypothetical protein
MSVRYIRIRVLEEDATTARYLSIPVTALTHIPSSPVIVY